MSSERGSRASCSAVPASNACAMNHPALLRDCGGKIDGVRIARAARRHPSSFLVANFGRRTGYGRQQLRN